MSLTWPGRLSMTFALLASACFLSYGLASAPPQTSQTQSSSNWIQEHYDIVRQRVLPERLELVPFPRSIQWVVVVSVHNTLATTEYWFSLASKYDGSIEMHVKTPRGGSLARQMRDLKEKVPRASLEALSDMLQFDERTITDAQMPELKRFAKTLESTYISPVMPDLLMSDPYGYHFWSASQHGQELGATLIGPGPDAPKQTHPLLTWMEELHKVTNDYIRSQK